MTGHVRRLEALRRAGVVERISDGVWHVPQDLVAQGKVYDRQRFGNAAATLHSHLPIEQQVRAIGRTWPSANRTVIQSKGASDDCP